MAYSLHIKVGKAYSGAKNIFATAATHLTPKRKLSTILKSQNELDRYGSSHITFKIATQTLKEKNDYY